MPENNTGNNPGIQPGHYQVEYFSGAQVSLYIGDVWVDEVTSIAYNVSQKRIPLYGYADQLFRDVAEGQVLVRGQFSINFKEAGYLWLILNRYKRLKTGINTLNPFKNSGTTIRKNIEQVVNKELSQFELNEAYKQLSSQEQKDIGNPAKKDVLDLNQQALGSASLTGFADVTRATGGIGESENIFEAFEDLVWGKETFRNFDEEEHRRADDSRLNPFDIYLTYGDFAGDNTVNHTIRKITNVYILGTSQQVVIDGMPIQETYDFLAQNIV